jgi:signal transduction histidine kinase
MAQDSRFARLVSLACHDLRTPLATVHGFARTLSRVDLPDPAPRYVEMIDAASKQLDELLDELSLVARIEAGRFEPTLAKADSLELARAAAGELDEGAVTVSGEGASVGVEPDAARRAIRQLARAARRHGGLETVTLTVRGAELELEPITPSSGPVVTGAELRELGPAVAVALIRALGGALELDGERLRIRLPASSGDAATR